MSEYTSLKTASIGAIAFVLLLLLIIRAIRPKPIPEIPYDVKAAKNIFGNLVAFITATNEREWIVRKAVELQSPMFQILLGPFMKPIVCLTDYAEIVDILERRPKEFDRSEVNIRGFEIDVTNILTSGM